MLFLNLFIVVCSFAQFSFGQSDGYWRDYYGGIPADAIVAGQNKQGALLYIGQVYVHDGGLINGQITLGSSDMYVDYQGVVHGENHIKIFCGFQQNYAWLETVDGSMLNDLKGKVPVIGGHEDGASESLIARLTLDGQTHIGRVLYNGTYSQIFLGVNDNHQYLESYHFDILIYNP